MSFTYGTAYDVRIEPCGERYTVVVHDRLRGLYLEYREIADTVTTDGLTETHTVTQLFKPLNELDELGKFAMLVTEGTKAFVDRLAMCLIDSYADFSIL